MNIDTLGNGTHSRLIKVDGREITVRLLSMAEELSLAMAHPEPRLNEAEARGDDRVLAQLKRGHESRVAAHRVELGALRMMLAAGFTKPGVPEFTTDGYRETAGLGGALESEGHRARAGWVGAMLSHALPRVPESMLHAISRAYFELEDGVESGEGKSGSGRAPDGAPAEADPEGPAAAG